MQILAIVLRDHHREPYRAPSCDPAPIEVFCNCTEDTPAAGAPFGQTVLLAAGASIGASIVGTLWCVTGCIKDEPVKPNRSRRRGGGVLSGTDSR